MSNSDPSLPDDPSHFSASRPKIGQRLLGDETTPSPHLNPSSGSEKRSFPKRSERYFSSILKLGHTYGTVKSILKRLSGLETQLSATRNDIDILRDSQGAALDMLHNVEEPINAQMAKIEGTLEKEKMAVKKRIEEGAERQERDITALRTEVSETSGHLQAVIAGQVKEQALLSRSYGDLTRKLDKVRSGETSALSPAPVDRSGLDAMLDSFYARLEDRYRGSREEIHKRLLKYLPDAEAAVTATNKPILDLGCGRGEWLELLRARDIDAEGVDLNEAQLSDAKALGLAVQLGDVSAFLANSPDGAYGMITAHHLAEHLPFADLAWITREAMRVLAPGGILLYETPNSANVVVGASSFHVDPTHLRPLPDAVLTTLFDTVGFMPVETRFLHPHPKQDELVREARLDPEIAGLLFGPQDLAVLGTKPAIAT